MVKIDSQKYELDKKRQTVWDIFHKVLDIHKYSFSWFSGNDEYWYGNLMKLSPKQSLSAKIFKQPDRDFVCDLWLKFDGEVSGTITLKPWKSENFVETKALAEELEESLKQFKWELVVVMK